MQQQRLGARCPCPRNQRGPRDGSCVLTVKCRLRQSCPGESICTKGRVMAWRLDGTYFESCSCDAVCPCTWSALTARATLDRCRALLAYHVDSGEIDGVDVSGLSFALFLDTPPVMSEGNWRVGVYLDEAASDGQAERLRAGVVPPPRRPPGVRRPPVLPTPVLG